VPRFLISENAHQNASTFEDSNSENKANEFDTINEEKW
jgi:hypothetical protein